MLGRPERRAARTGPRSTSSSPERSPRCAQRQSEQPASVARRHDRPRDPARAGQTRWRRESNRNPLLGTEPATPSTARRWMSASGDWRRWIRRAGGPGPACSGASRRGRHRGIGRSRPGPRRSGRWGVRAAPGARRRWSAGRWAVGPQGSRPGPAQPCAARRPRSGSGRPVSDRQVRNGEQRLPHVQSAVAEPIQQRGPGRPRRGPIARSRGLQPLAEASRLGPDLANSDGTHPLVQESAAHHPDDRALGEGVGQVAGDLAGAGDGGRTRDLLLGKETLYH